MAGSSGVIGEPSQGRFFRLRLDRARDLHAEFGRLWAGYVQGHPWDLVREVDEDGCGRVILKRHAPLPGELSLVLGDFLQQLRAALDNCLYSVAVLDSGQDPPPNGGRLQWPIAVKASDWPREVKRLEGLAPRLLAYLEAGQPYRAELPAWNCLRILHDMARVDRHRTPHLVTVFHSGGRVRVDTTRVADFSSIVGPVEPDGVVATFRRVGTDPITAEHLHVDFEFDVDVAGLDMSPLRPGGVPSRPWGSLDHRLRALLRAVTEYMDGLLNAVQQTGVVGG